MEPHRHIGYKGNTRIGIYYYVQTYVSIFLCGSKKYFLAGLLFFVSQISTAQSISKVWVADNGDGTYKNPIIHADYSDPDAIRVGNDYYMISSSFNHVPGLPILHSKDLVNWELIGHALNKNIPEEHFGKVQHGGGVWAPSIRYHNNEFYIYYPDPDFGIYLVRSKNILGPWTEPLLVEAGKGLIDPCPLWDDNGKVYLVHAFAGSRAGIKSIIVVKELNKEGTKAISDAVMVYDGHEKDPTIEGPKFYKRNGFYYIFAPAGGVSTGWQTVLRSKNVYGPYERKVVMDKGETPVNGPHQGAWVQTQSGEDWFLHFQDKEAYGRVVHLQPMKWVNDWPVIGEDKDADGKGQPVLVHKKPNVGKVYPIITVGESDEFNTEKLGLQWQWQANPQINWAFTIPSKGMLRLNSFLLSDSSNNFWNVPALLLQKFPADEFTATTKVLYSFKTIGEKTGLVILGLDYACIAVHKTANGIEISYSIRKNADNENSKPVVQTEMLNITGAIYFSVKVSKDGICTFSYSSNGIDYRMMTEKVTIRPGKWVGAKIGLFCLRNNKTNDAGFADIDWFRIEKN